MKTRLVLLLLSLLILLSGANGVPSITSSSSNGSDDTYPVLAIDETILFTVVVNESVSYVWYTDDVNQSNNFDNLTESWDSKGYKNVSVWAINVNGTTQTTRFNPYVKMQMATAADEVCLLYTSPSPRD